MLVVERRRDRRAGAFGCSLKLGLRLSMVLAQPTREGLHQRIVGPVEGEPRFLDREEIGVRGPGQEVELGAEVRRPRGNHRQGKTDDNCMREVHALVSRAIGRAVLHYDADTLSVGVNPSTCKAKPFVLPRRACTFFATPPARPATAASPPSPLRWPLTESRWHRPAGSPWSIQPRLNRPRAQRPGARRYSGGRGRPRRSTRVAALHRRA